MVSKHIISEVNDGNKVVVVVSAQGKTTDKLIAEELSITKNPVKKTLENLRRKFSFSLK